MSRPTTHRATGKNRPTPETFDKPGLETRRVATKLLAAVVDAHAGDVT
ncbi:hypothetical protein [Nitratireductor rhodophyticola]